MKETLPTTKPTKILNWIINPDGLRDHKSVLEERSRASQPNLEFFVLLIISTIIATVGLIENSAATVIGAMIVAPLMDPIVSLAFGLSTNNIKLIRQSLTLITLGATIVILTSGLIYQLLDINFIDSQILSRTSPSLIDLSVAIAAGIVGAFAQSRSRLTNSMAGVAIAVALVPPLCVTGIGIKLSAQASLRFNEVIIPSLSHQIPEEAFLLFMTNLIGITAAGMCVFLAQRYGSIRRCWKFALACLALTAILCAPLSKSLQEFTISKNIQSAFKDYRLGEITSSSGDTKYVNFWKHTRVIYCNTKTNNETIEVSLVLNAPETAETSSILKSAFDSLEKKVEAKSGYQLNSTLSVVGNHIYNFHTNPDDELKQLNS